MGWAVATNFFWAGVLTLTFPSIFNRLEGTGTLALYA